MSLKPNQELEVCPIQLYNYRAIQQRNYITWKTIKLQHAILEALYIR